MYRLNSDLKPQKMPHFTWNCKLAKPQWRTDEGPQPRVLTSKSFMAKQTSNSTWLWRQRSEFNQSITANLSFEQTFIEIFFKTRHTLQYKLSRILYLTNTFHSSWCLDSELTQHIPKTWVLLYVKCYGSNTISTTLYLWIWSLIGMRRVRSRHETE